MQIVTAKQWNSHISTERAYAYCYNQAMKQLHTFWNSMLMQSVTDRQWHSHIPNEAADADCYSHIPIAAADADCYSQAIKQPHVYLTAYVDC